MKQCKNANFFFIKLLKNPDCHQYFYTCQYTKVKITPLGNFWFKKSYCYTQSHRTKYPYFSIELVEKWPLGQTGQTWVSIFISQNWAFYTHIKRSWSGRESNPDLCWTLLTLNTLNIMTYSPSRTRSRRHAKRSEVRRLCIQRLWIGMFCKILHEIILIQGICGYSRKIILYARQWRACRLFKKNFWDLKITT